MCPPTPGILPVLCAPTSHLRFRIAQIEELEETLREKNALLQKSLQSVNVWEGKFAALRSAQEPLLFK